MQQCIKIYYSIFIRSSTCFGRHTAQHQEPKTALAPSGLLSGRLLEVWLLDAVRQSILCLTASSNHTSNNLLCLTAYSNHTSNNLLSDSAQQPHGQQPSTYANQRLLVQF